MITYTTIIHQAREELGLSLNEYAVADIIYQLQNNPDSLHPGWCYASKETLGICVGVSKQAIHSILKKLYERGYLEKQEGTKHIRANSSWYNIVISTKSDINKYSKESLPIVKKVYSEGKETLLQDSKESLPNNNKIYNNKYNILKETEVSEQINPLIKLFEPINPSYKTLFGNKTQRKALERLVLEHSYEKVEEMIKSLPEVIRRPYAPRITTPLQFEQKLGELIVFSSQEKNKGGSVYDARTR